MPRKKLSDAELLNRVLEQQRRAQETAAKLKEARRKKTTRMKIVLGGLHFAAAKLGGWQTTYDWLDQISEDGVNVETARTALEEYLKEAELLEALRHGARPERPQPEEGKKPPQPARPEATTPPQTMQNDDPDTWVTV